MVFNSIGTTDYYFFKVAATMNEIPPAYTLITDNEERYKIDINKLRSMSIEEEIRRVPQGNVLMTFIQNFSLTAANRRKKIIAKIPVKTAPVAPMPEPEPVIAAPQPQVKTRKPRTMKPKTGIVAPEPLPVAQEPVTVAQEPVPFAPVPVPVAPVPVPAVKKIKAKIKIAQPIPV